MNYRALPATQVVGILGGMGPAAGADFVRLFVVACTERMRVLQVPVCDQAYPEHWLAQVPVPDRSNALRHPDSGGHQPVEPMLQETFSKVSLPANNAPAVPRVPQRCRPG